MPPHPPDSQYWLIDHTNKDAAIYRPYYPTLCHDEYDLTVGDVPRRRFFRRLLISMGIGHRIRVPACQVTIHLENSPVGGGVTRTSQEFRQGQLDDPATRDALVDEPFSLPLELNNNNEVQDQTWYQNTRVVLIMNNPGAVHHISFRAVARTNAPGHVAPVDLGQKTIAQLLLVPNIQYQHIHAAGVHEYTGPITDFFAAATLNQLGWEGSPYKLLAVAYFQQDGRDYLLNKAWTYFHRPSQIDVRIVDYQGRQQVVMQKDGLDAFQVNNPQEADLKPTGAQIRRFTQYLPTLRERYRIVDTQYDENKQSVFFRQDDGRHFCVMSWAGIMVASRQMDGSYRADKLYTLGDQRNVFIETGAEDEPPFKMLERGGLRHDRLDAVSTPSGAAQRWDKWDLYFELLTIDKVITYGISSCVAMMLFPKTDDDADPAYVIFAHINNDSSNPLPLVIADALTADEKLRAIASIHPEPLEFDKYHKNNLFPGGIRADSETLYLPRESHIAGYNESLVRYKGHDQFGMSLPTAGGGQGVRVIGTYGLSQLWFRGMVRVPAQAQVTDCAIKRPITTINAKSMARAGRCRRDFKISMSFTGVPPRFNRL